jgi:hypothetical protein
MTTQRLLPLLALLATAACSSLTEPVSFSVTPEAAPTPSATALRPAPSAAPVPTPAPQPQGELVAASHVLVAYKGALRADPSIERSKDEAKTRALSVLARARKGDDFAALADSMSDDPSAKRNHGSLGKFTREQMVKPFADAAFALKPGGVSDLVETQFGFHVIKRTE